MGLCRDTISKFLNGKPVDYENFKEICRKLGLDDQEIADFESDSTPTVVNPPEETTCDFVGREEAIADLDQLKKEGITCVLIKGRGGVGKTLLAERYLMQRFPGRLLRFDIARETQMVGSASGLLESKLKELGEEPGREFMVSCDRLRSKLQSEAIGVLVDNLEPALDANGRLIPEHREYVELLRVLSDSSLRSFTLITSRERIGENLNIRFYPLQNLTVEAWRDYFRQKNLNHDSPVMVDMHRVYQGNALAMKVLRQRIALDVHYQGQIENYWEEHQTEEGVAFEREIENLISEQFERLATVYPHAYDLLCRMGCFRYQDVLTVPREGLFCLLWGVSPRQAQKVIDALFDLALVDRVEREYRLHPLIREQAIERLNHEDWENTNRISAIFWTDSVETIETEKNAITALEAYYHYLQIEDFNSAADVIAKERDNFHECNEPLACSFYRLGLLLQIKQAINTVKNKVKFSFSLGVIYNILGDTYWIIGEIRNSLSAHNKSAEIAKKISDEQKKCGVSKRIQRLYSVSFFNQGLCKMDLLEIEEAINLCEFHLSLDVYYGEDFNSYSFLAFLYAYIDSKKESEVLLEKSISLFCQRDFNKVNSPSIIHTWSVGYYYIFTGKAYHELGEINNAEMQYNKAIIFASNTNFLQAKAKALTGLGEIYMQSNLEVALNYHNESILILDNIGAKCDLAEAYYQQALTYQQIGESEKSEQNFQKAIQLFEAIEAPKQVEKVRKSMEKVG
jgi:tetratricopeptide (TPR) repeat protein